MAKSHVHSAVDLIDGRWSGELRQPREAVAFSAYEFHKTMALDFLTGAYSLRLILIMASP